MTPKQIDRLKQWVAALILLVLWVMLTGWLEALQ